MNDTPFRGSRPGLAAARTLPHVDLSPAGLTADLPQEAPGFPGNERVVNVDAPPAIRLEGVVAGILNSISQRHADLTAFVDGVSDNLAIFGGEIDGGTVIPQLSWRGKLNRVTRTVTLREGQAEAKLHGLIGREVASIESADVLRTHFLRANGSGGCTVTLLPQCRDSRGWQLLPPRSQELRLTAQTALPARHVS